jgi:hypothetical protein
MGSVSQFSQVDSEVNSSCDYHECVSRLADALDERKHADLEEVESLISQLAVVLEL